MSINPKFEKPSLYSLTLSDLRDYLQSKGFAKFAADQIYQWMYKIQERDMEKWTNVSRKSVKILKRTLIRIFQRLSGMVFQKMELVSF